jgi:hypothetical protein
MKGRGRRRSRVNPFRLLLAGPDMEPARSSFQSPERRPSTSRIAHPFCLGILMPQIAAGSGMVVIEMSRRPALRRHLLRQRESSALACGPPPAVPARSRPPCSLALLAPPSWLGWLLAPPCPRSFLRAWRPRSYARLLARVPPFFLSPHSAHSAPTRTLPDEGRIWASSPHYEFSDGLPVACQLRGL